MSKEHVNGSMVDASLFELANDASTEIEIVNPKTRAGTGIFITVLSRDSDAAKAVSRRQLNRRLDAARRTRGGVALTAEELDEETLELLVICTKSWRGMQWQGKPFDCTPENVRFIYEKSPHIIREQVEDAMANRALFTRS